MSDKIGCPVHHLSLADQTEFLFSSSKGRRFKDGMFAQHLVPSTIVKEHALIFCTLCVCHAILALPSRGESLGWQVHAWQSNPVLDHQKIETVHGVE